MMTIREREKLENRIRDLLIDSRRDFYCVVGGLPLVKINKN